MEIRYLSMKTREPLESSAALASRASAKELAPKHISKSRQFSGPFAMMQQALPHLRTKN